MKKTLAIVLALAMVLCMIPVSFAVSEVEPESFDLYAAVIGEDGNNIGGTNTTWGAFKEDANSITLKYNYESEKTCPTIDTGRYTRDAKMAMIKVKGFMLVEDVTEVTIDGVEIEVGQGAPYGTRVENNNTSLTKGEDGVGYLLFPIELTKAGYYDTMNIRVVGTRTDSDSGFKYTVTQTAKITVKLENTADYKTARDADIYDIETNDRGTLDAYIVGDKIYLDFVAKKSEFLNNDKVEYKKNNILKITFCDDDGDLFDVETWAYEPSSTKKTGDAIIQLSKEANLEDSALNYNVVLTNRVDTDYAKGVTFKLETDTAIYETGEYDVVVRYGVREADPKGVYFAESSKTIKVGETYSPVVLGVATNARVDADLAPGSGTDVQVVDFNDDGDAVIGTREGVAYITASYTTNYGKTYKTNAMKITVTAQGATDDDDDDKDGKTYMVTASSLRVRSGAGTNFSQIGSLKNGATVKVESIANGWAKLENGGYVSAQYLAEVVDNGEAQTMYVTARTLNVRKGPGTSYAKVGTLSRGTAVQVVGFSGNWAKLSNGYYVSTSYLAK